jgi:nitrogen regulatory protein PII-like uncharacterized protein
MSHSSIHNSAFTESFWYSDEDTDNGLSLNRAVDLRGQIINILEQAGFTLEPLLMHKVVSAQDIHALWFLRPDIMQAISLILDEEQARAIMCKITTQFVGFMPESVFKQSHFSIRTLEDTSGYLSHPMLSQPMLSQPPPTQPFTRH